MPDLTDKTTQELLDDLGQAPLTQPAAEIVAELVGRIIEENDIDDSNQHRGGIRPTHQPINP